MRQRRTDLQTDGRTQCIIERASLLKNQPVTKPTLYWSTPKNKTRGGDGTGPRTKKYLIGEIGHFTGSAVLSGQTNHFIRVVKPHFWKLLILKFEKKYRNK